jgi:hypothetical protein
VVAEHDAVGDEDRGVEEVLDHRRQRQPDDLAPQGGRSGSAQRP